MKFHTKYSHEAPTSPSGGPSMTKGQFKDECDINRILNRFGAGGTVVASNRSMISGDFTGIRSFEECLERVTQAKDEFAALPAAIRARFGNDPRAYVDFVLDERNVDECVRLGLREVAQPVEDAVDVLKRIEGKLSPEGKPVA